MNNDQYTKVLMWPSHQKDKVLWFEFSKSPAFNLRGVSGAAAETSVDPPTLTPIRPALSGTGELSSAQPRLDLNLQTK